MAVCAEKVTLLPWRIVQKDFLDTKTNYPFFFVIINDNNKKMSDITQHLLTYTVQNIKKYNPQAKFRTVEVVIGKFGTLEEAQNFSQLVQNEKCRKEIPFNIVDLAVIIAFQYGKSTLRNPDLLQLQRFSPGYSAFYDAFSIAKRKYENNGADTIHT